MSEDSPAPRERVTAWFASQGWKPFAFQHEVWDAYLSGRDGLVHAATGMGKTLAVWMSPLLEWMAAPPEAAPQKRKQVVPLQVLWITPLRALASDTEAALREPVEALGIPWVIERRTGDVSATVRSRQSRRLPAALVTTPESLSLLLARNGAAELFQHLRLIVVDEWHELLGTKRGVQTELALARLRHWRPRVRLWGLSATLGNTAQAAEVLMGLPHAQESREAPLLIQGQERKRVEVHALLPEDMRKFPWAGHLGLPMAPRVVDAIARGGSTLIFTNTRSQAELWHQGLLQLRPDWQGHIGVHHGSLSTEERERVEAGLNDGTLRAVVSTSSLDLGVDFRPVDRVFNVGSPKGIARLLQRAGRSGHQPGATSVVHCVPANAFEIIEAAAAKDGIAEGDLESRAPLQQPMDVLVQHAVTVAVGGGFTADALFEEVRRSYAYRGLSREQWDWVLEFVTRGGSLAAYPQFHRVAREGNRYAVNDPEVARQHRVSIGTITADAAVQIQFLRGAKLGSIEESFVGRLRKGDRFVFAGRTLELLHLHDMKAYVKLAGSSATAVPRWMGGRMPLSTHLSRHVRQRLEQAREGIFEGSAMQAVRPMLELQQEWSALPGPDDILVERFRTKEGHHLAIFPFEGRLVHEGLASLFANRMARLRPISFSIGINDYGFELTSPEPAPFEEAYAAGLFSPDNLLADIENALNLHELARRRFRIIARVAGLVFEGYPWARKNARQVHASTSLLYDVLHRHDPGHPLVTQARREVLEQEFEHERLHRTLEQMGRMTLLLMDPGRPTPLSFPLFVEIFRERVSSEKLADRIRRMQTQLERKQAL
jgi:ATP-dependent Lhr-like helicase